MKKADVVIGANWGDEGKGLVTDFLAAPYGSDALVVRFCGGAQAAHTVTTPAGERHVFSHFGSGSLCGSATYLSRFFACNPILFLAELARLKKFGLQPKVYIDPVAAITTPYDMMINQLIEQQRGAHRHGSCGLGFGETIERQQHPDFALRFADLFNAPLLKAKLAHIRDAWVPQRLRKLNVTALAPEWQERLSAESILLRYVEDCSAFLDCVKPAGISLVSSAKHVIFEGAQGLLLDQNHAWFPHVTRSNTGLQNVIPLAQEAGIDALTTYYATRAYATRHGAGPLPHECAEKPYEKIVDLTNVPNPYQGTLRFGLLDLDLLQATIRHDMHQSIGKINVTPRLVMSCMDQLDDVAQYVHHGIPCARKAEQLLATASTLIPAAKLLASYGPTRQTIQPFSPAVTPVAKVPKALPRFNSKWETHAVYAEKIAEHRAWV